MDFIIRVLIIYTIFLALDSFTFLYLKKYVKNIRLKLFIAGNLLLVFVSFVLFFFNFYNKEESSQFFSFTLVLILYIPKFIFLLAFIFDIFLSLLKSVGDLFKNKFDFFSKFYSLDRYRYLVVILFYGIFVLYLLYGLFIGKTDYRLDKKKIFFNSLPSNFDGLKIIQISDLHLGSFGGRKNLDKVVDIINKQEPDIVVFTGDIVNQTSRELTKDYIISFSNIKSKMGKFCIFGNHDYGGYFVWDRDIDSLDNINCIKKFFNETGFVLLDNKNITLRKDTSEIYLLGVDNYGKKMPFGDLVRADFLLPKEGFKILLSHDPYHFDEVIKKYKGGVDLTLSGHTHGIQIGVNIMDNYYSLMSLWKDKVIGLYKENGKYIYINRGLGVSAIMLFRVGIIPEITLITLKNKII